MIFEKLAPPLARIVPIPDDPTLAARLETKLDKSGGPESCWPFQGKCQNGGYGVIWSGGAGGKTYYAHRVAWKIHNGRDPGQLAVCHRCDNPPCCNPAHLFLGSIADNVADMIGKGRAKITTHRGQPRGEQVGGSKLTAGDVAQIRERAAAGEGSGTLGKVYGVDSSTVRQIVRREIWRHVAEA